MMGYAVLTFIKLVRTAWAGCEVGVDAAQAACADQVRDEGVRPVPLPGEPAAGLGFRDDDRGADGGCQHGRRALFPGPRGASRSPG